MASGIQDITEHPFFAGLDWFELKKERIMPPHIPKVRGLVNNSYDHGPMYLMTDPCYFITLRILHALLRGIFYCLKRFAGVGSLLLPCRCRCSHGTLCSV